MEGGGAEKQFCLLLNGLKKKNIECHAVILKGGVNLKLLTEAGVRVYVVTSNSNYDIRILFKLIKLFKAVRPDVVEVWQHPLDVIGGLAAFILRIPFVVTERTDPNRFDTGIKSYLRKWLIKRSAAVVSNSEIGKIFWKNFVPNRIKCIYAPNIVSIPEETLHGVKDDNYIIYVGRLNKDKNILTLINAFSLVVKTLPKLKLYMLGEGELQNECQMKVKQLGITANVVFKGYEASPYNLVKNAKLFVLLSFFEGMPNAALEAAALKTPLLLSDIPQHRKIFDPFSAVFVDPLDPEKISNQILMALDPYNSQDLKVLSNNAFKSISRFSEDEITELYINLYKSILNSNENS